MGARNMKRSEREQLDALVDELARNGVTEYSVVQRKKHVLVRWQGGSMTLAGTPSCSRVVANLRASVRRQCRLHAAGASSRRA